MHEDTAAKVLATFSVSLEKVRAEVTRLLAPRRKTSVVTKDNVVMCRLDVAALDAIDTLVEARIRPTRSAAAAWLIQAGIDAHATLFEQVSANVAQIRRLREETWRLGRQLTESHGAAGAPAAEAEAPGATGANATPTD